MAPPPTFPSAQALEPSPTRRRQLLIGALGLLALIWFFYPSKVAEPQVLHRAPHRQVCPQETLNVAIIGAGSAGASAAYYLDQFRQPCHRLNITVYERNDYVGGRSTTVNVYGDPTLPVELGASIFVPINHNLVNAANRFDLPVKNRGRTSKWEDTEILGIWDGREFVFTQSDADSQYWNIARLLWKYGISPIRTQNLMKRTVGSFLKMYRAPYFPFKSIAETAVDLDLLGTTTATGQHFLEANGVSGKFGHDIVQAATRVNYAQNLDQIHGLETMVCMAAEGGMSIEGGNWQIFDNMIKDSGATLLLNTAVSTITKDSGKYAIRATILSLDPAQDIESTESTYDTIILASPLQFSNIAFSPALSSPPPFIPYVSLHVTLFTSPYRLSPAAFNLDSGVNMPTTILTTTPPDTAESKTLPFNSISNLGRVGVPEDYFNPPSPKDDVGCGTRDSHYLYKIFSPQPLSQSYIESLLEFDHTMPHKYYDILFQDKPISWIYEKRWDSYPYLPPKSTFADIRLTMANKEEEEGEDSIWYTSGIESFISTMETSSLMGMNVARLVVDEWMEDNPGDGDA
ncbi:MAG: hypothetical protein L6R38_004239 [Xanthoria sp. 2 TBL-2021]|nr:MAG: hypothetical protein L6R38_004239 [Xanthoria sp. 2 TBL-2021]